VPHIDEWRAAQERAVTAADWAHVDQLAIELSKLGFTGCVTEAVHLAILRLRDGNDLLPIEPGATSEIWIEHFLHAVWDALQDMGTKGDSFWNLPLVMHSISSDGRLVAVSGPWCDLLGYEHSDVIGRRSIEFLSDRSRKDALEIHLPQFWKTGSISKVRYEFVRKSGQVVPLIMSACSEYNNEGDPFRSVAVLSRDKN